MSQNNRPLPSDSLAYAHRRCAELYRDGHYMYTKDRILDIQEQVRNNPEDFRLIRMDESEATQQNEDRPGRTAQIEFLTYEEITNDLPRSRPYPLCTYCVGWFSRWASHWDGLAPVPEPTDIAHHASGSTAVPVAGTGGMDAADRKQAMWQTAFSAATEYWEETDSCMHLMNSINRGFEVAPEHWATVNKIVCFALGEPTGPEQRERMVQHAMVNTVAEMVEDRFGTEVRKLSQEPGYSDVTKAALRRQGWGIIDEPGGAGAFLELDYNTVVVSIHPPLAVKQVMAEIARPIMCIMNAVIPEDHTYQHGHWRFAKWVESPRTWLMWEEYAEEYVFDKREPSMRWAEKVAVMFREMHPPPDTP